MTSTVQQSKQPTVPPRAGRMAAYRPVRAVLAFGILSAVLTVAAAVLMLWGLRAAELARGERELSNLAATIAEQTAQAMGSVDRMLRGTEERLRRDLPSGYLIDEKAVHTMMRARIDGMPQVGSLSVIDADGKLRFSSLDLPVAATFLGEHAYFAVHKEGPARGLYVGRPLQRPDGPWQIPLSQRFEGPDGAFAGVVVAMLEPRYFEQFYRSLDLGEDSAIGLYLRDGTYLAGNRNTAESIGKSFADSPVFRALDAEPRIDAVPTLRTQAPAPTILAYRELSEFPFVITVSARESALLAGWRQHAMFIAAGVTGVLLIVAVATLWLRSVLLKDQRLVAALGASEGTLKGIVDSAMDAILTVDADQRIVLFNAAAEKMFGCTAGEALGAPLERFLPRRLRDSHREHVRKFGQTGQTSRAMGEQQSLYGLNADGEEFPIEASISFIERDGATLYTAIVRDVTLRRRAEEALHASHQQLRELSAALLDVREEERTHIARELHDELGQHLTGLKMDLTWMRARVRDDQPELAGKIAGMRKLIDATVAATRRIASELRPMMLDDLGLVAAVEWLGQDFSRRTGVEVAMDLDIGGLELPDALATSLYRIVQESLTNVARHADAQHVEIVLKHSEGTLLARVRDDGKGMNPDRPQAHRSFGLLGMRERAYMLGGKMHILSQPGMGTTVEVTVSLAKPVSRETA